MIRLQSRSGVLSRCNLMDSAAIWRSLNLGHSKRTRLMESLYLVTPDGLLQFLSYEGSIVVGSGRQLPTGRCQ